MNPYLLPRPAIVSFSGGRTSGFMLRKVIEAFGGALPEDVVPVFANTGLEDSRTLEFVEQVGRRWCRVVMLERPRKGGHVDVDIASCSRNGEPFSQLITDKSFLPNPVARICTANLKIKVIESYAKSLGWSGWTVAVGLRADEPRRVARLAASDLAVGYERVAPISAAGHTLDDVTSFWARQEFDLAFPPGDNVFGNCVGCFLKGRGRLDQIAREQPSALEWWIKEEARMKATFRSDRPPYSSLLKRAVAQPLLYEDDTMPCDCHG